MISHLAKNHGVTGNDKALDANCRFFNIYFKKEFSMRMWNINPAILCNKHLCGEHVEMHMFLGCLRKGKSIQGYIDKGLVEIDYIIPRHNKLANEMIRRKMNHHSPLENIEFIYQGPNGKVDILESALDLFSRCKKCYENFKIMLSQNLRDKILI